MSSLLITNLITSVVLTESIVDELKQYVSYKARAAFLANKKQLEWLGEGSSREAFALDKKNVIKLAKNEIGNKQNIVEHSRWINASPEAKQVLAKVLKLGPNGDWLIMERVFPFNKHDEDKFEQVVGFKPHLLRNLEICAYNGEQHLDHMIQQDEEWVEQYKERNKTRGVSGLGSSTREERMNALKQLKQNQWFQNLCKAAKELTGNFADLEKIDHYGLTSSKRVVLLDYGVDDEIQQQHYGYNPYLAYDQAMKREFDAAFQNDDYDQPPSEDEYGHPIPKQQQPKISTNEPIRHQQQHYPSDHIPF